MNAYMLARLADCMDPDRPDSPGSLFLEAVWESYEEGMTEDDVFETVDSMIPVYTHDRWMTFVDLGAYQEEVETDTRGDMTQMAAVALFQIGERLLFARLEGATPFEATLDMADGEA